MSALIAEQSRELVALVFFVIMGTVAVYGLGAGPLSRRLGLSQGDATGILFAGADSWARLAAKALLDEGQRVMMVDTNFANVSAARMLGIEAHRANILSEFAEEVLDFNGIGHLIAGTPNDEVNSIAAFRFRHQFGTAGCWQVAPADRHAHHRSAAAGEVRSRICFTGSPGHADLAELAARGAKMKRVLMTEKFGLQDFEEANPEAVIMFLSDAKGLRPVPPDLGKVPSGTAVIAMVPEETATA